MKKILIILVGSHGINNFFTTKIMNSFVKKFHCEFMVDKSLKKEKKLIKLSKKLKINYLDITKIANFQLSLLEKFLVYSFYFRYSSLNNSFKSYVIGKNPKKILRLPFLILFSFFYEKLINLSLKINTVDKDLSKIFNNKKFDECLLMTGGVGNFQISLIKILKEKKINFSIMYTGMDNIYSKMPLYFTPNRIFVWGEHMKNFAKKIYKSKVITTGVVQYQDYFLFLKKRNKNLLIKKNRNFLNKIHNLNKNKKIILYAGPVHPYDETLDLDIISESLAKNKLNGKYQVLFRPHPHRKFIKADNFYDKKYSNIKIDSTVSLNYEKSFLKSNTNLDMMTDPEYFVKLLPCIDLIISPLSTLVLEAAIFDKPCLVVGYGGLKNRYLKDAIQWGHFDAILKKEWFKIASNKKELSSLLLKQLNTKYKKNIIHNDSLKIVDKKTSNFDQELVKELS